jgi:ubiquinone/menaquinone biosynthesis C-methylase UbiE
VIATDLALEMLRTAPRDLAPRVQADASRLPFPDATIDCLALVNMLLFVAEADRIVAPDGVILWVNTRGPHTPIHLSADEVGGALGAGWDGVASTAGEGTWAVFHRVR